MDAGAGNDRIEVRRDHPQHAQHPGNGYGGYNNSVTLVGPGNNGDVTHIRGGAGRDTVVFDGYRHEYALSQGEGGVQIYTDRRTGAQYYVHNDVEQIEYSKQLQKKGLLAKIIGLFR